MNRAWSRRAAALLACGARRLRRRLILALGVSALAACTVGPDFHRPTPALPAAYPDDAAADAAGAAPDAGTAPARLPVDWWKLFGDARLDALVAGALARNASLELAVAQVEEADAALREARAGQWPELDGNAAAARNRSSQGTGLFPTNLAPIRNDYRIGLSTAFELDLWGRLRRLTEAARARLLASRYARDVVALALAGSTVEAYFTLRSLERQVALTRDSIADYDGTIKIIDRRVAAGYASGLERAQAESARATAAAQLRDLARQRAAIQHQLAQLAGTPGQVVEDGDLFALPDPALPPPGLPSTLVERRPDVAAAEQVVAAATAQIGATRAQQLPTFSLTASYGYESDALDALLKSPASAWSLGTGVVGPILDAGKYAARTAQAEARQKQASAAWRGSVENAFREVADALAGVRETSAAESDLKRALDNAREAERIARSRYERGYAGYYELLDARRTVDAAELQYVRNRQALLTYDAELMKALGGGWSPN